ncbi:MAG: 1-acyl-sn-glycerol-3-phosphate acyltransferase [Bacteroidales bacterium]|nr:1-acyl-sn-glycerol-3-phosphate acyltransferase [Bacteroidales bacterium]
MKYLDLEDVIEKSKSRLLKRLPKFIVKLIIKIVKQEEINLILTNHSSDIGVDFLNSMIKEFNLTLEIEGKENLPENGRCFFVSNHPFGIIDGLVLTHTIAEKYGTLKAIGNDAFMYIPHLRPLIAAVNSFGKSSKEYINALEDVFDSDTPITHFPAGEVSRVYSWRVQDCKWQKSMITKAISKKRDIVPIHFYGKNSRLFYSIGIIRMMFWVKLNLELMLLPSEMLKKQNQTIRVRIGKPIPYQKFDSTLSHWDWAQKVRKHVYNIGKGKDTNSVF